MGKKSIRCPRNGELFLGLTRLDDALTHATKAGNNPTARAVLREIVERRGNFAAALKAYQDAVTLAPDKEEYRVSLGYDLIQHQSFESASLLLEQSVTLFPRSAKLRTLLGIALYSYGDPAKAQASLVDAIEVDPKMEAAYRCLARIVLQSSAAPPAAVIERLCPWNATVCAAMKLRVARGNHDPVVQKEAIEGLMHAPASDTFAHCELARAWEWTDRLPEARVEMEACLRVDPSSPQNHYRLGLIYKRLGLDEPSRKQMDERNRLLQRMSDETAAGLEALKSFR